MQQLRDSGLFRECPPQTNGSVCFQLHMAERGASIYVVRNELEVHIRARALRVGRFPNNQRLSDFVVRNAHGTIRGPENSAYAYRLASEHIGAVLDIVRAGL